MCVAGAPLRRRRSRLCCAALGRPTITRPPCARVGASEPSALEEEAGPGCGVVARTGTSGGASAGVRPTAPVSTAISTATPIPASAPASSQARRSEGCSGGCGGTTGSVER
jgi:hypothetical protein